MNLTRRLRRPGRVRSVAIVMLGISAIVLGGAATAFAQAPTPEIEGEEIIPTPDQTLSDDGRTVSAGDATMTVSQVRGLDPEGQTLEVTGTGFDENKGIYVTYCVVGPRDETPSPCGGGAAIEGATGASVWISSNPPRYGVELVEPWGPDGSFDTEVLAVAEFSDGTNDFDCREVQCAVVTRNDHTRPTDRGQDLVVPVTFEGADDPTVPTDSVLAATDDTVADDDAADEASSDDDSTDDGAPGWVFPVVGIVIVAAAVGGALVFLRRRSA